MHTKGLLTWTLILGGLLALSALGSHTPLLPTAEAAPIFSEGPQFGVGITKDMHTADFNGDTLPDILIINNTSPSYIWLNNGQNGFTRGASFEHSGSTGTAVADFDSDNDLDIVITTARNGFFVWINDGQGQFTERGTLGAGGPQYTGAAAADLNNDGHTDLFLITNQNNEVWLHTTSSYAGNLFSNIHQDIPDSFTNDITLADVDDDGDTDAITANRSGISQLWLNDGAGTFATGQEFSTHWELDVTAADIDNDNDIDLFFSTYLDNDTLWVNQGGRQEGTIGQFQLSSQTFYTGTSTSASFGDIDNDGDQDLVIGRSFGNPDALWLNQGGDQDGTTGQFTANTETFPIDTANDDTILADLNNDSQIDILFGNNGPNIIYWNDATTSLGVDLELTSCCSGPVQVSANDSLLRGTYHYVITNQGTLPATNVTLSISDSRLGSVLQSDDGTCANLVCTFGQLEPGESVTATGISQNFRQTSNHNYVGTFAQSAYVEANEEESNLWNNTATEQTTFIDCDQGCFIEELFCASSFSFDELAEKSVLSWVNHLTSNNPDSFVPDIALYYNVRTQMLVRENGAHYSDLYDQHNTAIFQTVVTDTDLWDDTLNTLALWEPNLRAFATGQADTAVITAEQVNTLNSYLTTLAENASPEIAAVITTELAQLPTPETFIGQTMTQAADQLLGEPFAHTNYLPNIQQTQP